MYLWNIRSENLLLTYHIFNYFNFHPMFSYKQNVNITEVFHVKPPCRFSIFPTCKLSNYSVQIFLVGFPAIGEIRLFSSTQHFITKRNMSTQHVIAKRNMSTQHFIAKRNMSTQHFIAKHLLGILISYHLMSYHFV